MAVRSRATRRLVALASLLLIAAACGGDDDDATSTGAQPSTTQGSAGAYDEGTTTTGSQGSAALEVADSDIGQLLTNDGRTLYLFEPDNAGTPTCNGDCAATWPPLLANGDVTVGDGLDQSLFGTVARDDGSEQVTVDGWPLYFFASDTAPGDHNGQGIGDVWYAVGPDGSPIED